MIQLSTDGKSFQVSGPNEDASVPFDTSAPKLPNFREQAALRAPPKVKDTRRNSRACSLSNMIDKEYGSKWACTMKSARSRQAC